MTSIIYQKELLNMQINFIDWVAFKDIWVDANMTLAEYCAQYSAVQTNWVYTLAGIIGIIILLINKNKKWYWYIFLALYTVMSVTSVGMHTADYGEFEVMHLAKAARALSARPIATPPSIFWKH